MAEKHFEIAAKSLVQKKLWQYGYQAKKLRFAPVDLLVNRSGKESKYLVKTICYSIKDKTLTIPEDAKWADVLAVVVIIPFTSALVYWLRLGFSHTEPMIGKSYKIGKEGDLIERDFVANPDKVFIGPNKGLVTPKQQPGLVAEEWYSPQEIAEYRLLGKQMSLGKVREAIDSKALKSSQWGKGNGKRIRVKGEWIIEYLANQG